MRKRGEKDIKRREKMSSKSIERYKMTDKIARDKESGCGLEGKAQRSCAHGWNGVGARASDLNVDHLPAGPLEAEQKEGYLPERRLHPVPRPGLDFEPATRKTKVK